MNIINLCPHQISLAIGEERILFPPSGQVARVASIPGGPVAGLPGDFPAISAPTWGQVEGLPDPAPDTIFIVSALVVSRAIGRADVFSPGTGPGDDPIRENGQVVAVRRFVQAPQ